MFEPLHSWGLYAAVLCVASIVLALTVMTSKKNRRLRQTKGLQWLSGFRQLLSHIQKHKRTNQWLPEWR